MEMPLCVPTTFQIDVRIGDRHAQLLKSFVDGEARETGCERNFAAGGQACADRDHIRFGDSALEEAIGKFLRKEVGVSGFGEVGVQRDDIFVLATEFDQSFAESLARGHSHLQFEFCFGFHLCELHQCFFHLLFGGRHAVKLGIVLHERDPFALHGVGDRSRWACFWLRQPLRKRPAGRGCCGHPDSMACQLKARHLSASGSSGMMSFTNPSSWM